MATIWSCDDYKIEKVITIKPKGITQKQWSILLLELNMIKTILIML